MAQDYVWSDILRMIKVKKSDVFHSFHTLSNLVDLGPYVVGMANHQGGEILIGVDVYNFHLLGTALLVEDVQTFIQSCCYPDIDYCVHEVMKQRIRLLVIHIKKSQQYPCYYDKTCYVMENESPKRALLHSFERQNQDPFYGVVGLGSSKVDDNSTVGISSETFSALDDEITRLEKFEAEEVAEQKEHVSDKQAGTPFVPSALEHVSFLALSSEEVQAKQGQVVKQAFNSTSVSLLSHDVNLKRDFVSDPIVQFESDQLSKSESDQLSKSESDQSESFESEQLSKSESDQLSKSKSDQSATFESDQLTSLFDRELNRRQQKVLKYLEQKPFVKNKIYRKLYDVSHKTAHLELLDLLNRQLINKVGKGRSTHYVLA